MPSKSLSTTHSTTAMGERDSKISNPKKNNNFDNPMEEEGPAEFEC